MFIELLESEALGMAKKRRHRGEVVDPENDGRLKRNRGKKKPDPKEEKAADTKDEGKEK